MSRRGTYRQRSRDMFSRWLPERAMFAEQGVSRREFIGLALGIFALMLLGLRLVWVQGFDAAGRAASAEEARLRQEVLPAARGEILDRNGAVLARSIQRYDLAVDQTIVDDLEMTNADGSTRLVTVREMIPRLADILGISDDEVKNALDGDKNFAYLYRNATPAQWNAVADLRLGYIAAFPVAERNYPNGELAGSVVGFMGNEGKALGGIELSQDALLRGEDGVRTYEISADGVRIPVAPEDQTPAVDGSTVTLTIDRDVQYFAQEIIAARVKELDAEWGSAVVLNVADGQVLAMADSSMLDPNDPGRAADPGDYSPRSVAAAVEPGSTEKTITAAAGIQEGTVDVLSEVPVPAELTVDGQTFQDAFDHPAQDRTFAGVIADSMNTGTVIVGKRLEPAQRYEWLRRFGVGQKTGIELASEGEGILADWQEWNGRQEYTVLFGQGVAQTPLRTATIFQTIANDGTRIEPRLVRSITDAQGTTTTPPAPEPVEVVSPETAAKVRELLESVVTVGGAPDAKVEGYRMGGKSGTAETPDAQGGLSGYTTSFVGIAPMENPRYVVGVTLQRPEGTIAQISASGTASKIMSKVLRHYSVPPSTSEPLKLPKFFGKDEELNDT